MQCSECGTEFSALREFCPKCGASSDPAVQARRRSAAEPRSDNLNRNRNRVLLIGAGLLATLGMVNAFDGDFGFGDHVRVERMPSPTANAAVEIEADALYRAFRDDPRGAERRFEGREMVVTGEFLRIVPDGYGSLDLRLRTSNPDVPIGVDVAELALDEAKQLRPGQRVTVSCQQMGGHDEELWVRDCAIQSVDGETSSRASPNGGPIAPSAPAAPTPPQAPAEPQQSTGD